MDKVVSLAVKHIVKAVPEKQNFVHYRFEKLRLFVICLRYRVC